MDARNQRERSCRSKAAIATRIGSERGWTLVELLVSVTVFAVVLGAVLSLLDVTNLIGYNDQERNTALTEDATGFQRMVGELRQAYQLNYPTGGTSSNVMDVNVRLYEGGAQQDRRVQYVCDASATPYNACLRYEASTSTLATVGPGQPLPGVTPTVVIPRVLNQTSADPNDPVFQNLASPDGSTGRPTYGDALVHTPGSGSRTLGYGHWVTLNDSFYIRQLAFAH